MLRTSQHNVVARLEGKRAWPFVIINSLAGQADFLNEEYYALIQSIEKAGASLPDDPRIQKLIARGYVDDGSEAAREAAALDQLHRSYDESRRNLYVVVPAFSCSLGCNPCLAALAGMPERMSEADLSRIFEIIDRSEADSSRQLKPLLIFYGGQTLGDDDLSVQLVREVLQSRLESFQRVTFYTSEFNIERYASVFERDRIENVTVVFNINQIDASADAGASRILGKELEAGLDFLRRRGVVVCLNVNVTSANVHQTPSFINAMMELGVAYSRNCIIRFTPTLAGRCPVYEPCAVDYPLYQKIFEIYADNPQLEFANFAGRGVLDRVQVILRSRDRFPPRTMFCEACAYLHIFDPRGHIQACYHALHDPSLAIGDWRKPAPIDEDKLRLWRDRNVLNVETCRACRAKYLCSGGCGYEAIQAKGSLYECACQPYEEILQSAFTHLYEDFMDSDRYGELMRADAGSTGS